MVAAIKVLEMKVNIQGKASINVMTKLFTKEILRMGSFMEKREPITSRMDALTQVDGRTISSKVREALSVKMVYHTKANLEKVKRMERVNSQSPRFAHSMVTE